MVTDSAPQTQIAVRTLLVAGFTLQQTHRQPRHIEICCQRTDILGATIPYLIALTELDELSLDEIEDIQRSAESQHRVPLIITRRASNSSVSWEDFTEALGGAIPSWNALDPTYNSDLLTVACNKLPEGQYGEAWLVFEDLVGYGLEFIFGRRAHRLGGRKRGRTVSDMQVQIPQGPILIIDTKAAQSGFDATWPELRPLIEYVQRQRVRQQGQLEIFSAVIVSSGFIQDDSRLDALTKQFYGEARVALSFWDAGTLSNMVETLRMYPHIRNAIRWTSILSGGRVHLKAFEDEVSAAQVERLHRGS